jgi:hypothetical protein
VHVEEGGCSVDAGLHTLELFHDPVVVHRSDAICAHRKCAVGRSEERQPFHALWFREQELGLVALVTQHVPTGTCALMSRTAAGERW